MKAIILAAGRGSRMKDLTDDRPKCLVEIHGRALLDWQLSALRDAGIDEIAVVTGYRRDMLVHRKFIEFHNSRWAQTNMVSSLECAHEWLEQEQCIVSYSDIFYEASAVRSLMECAADLAITFDPNWLRQWEKRFADPLSDAESFRLAVDGSVAEIGNKPKSLADVQGQYMGLLKFSPTGWNEVQRIRSSLPADARDRMHMTGTLQMVIDNGRVPIQAVTYSGDWGEVDSQEDLEVLSR
jgi:choline kinase